MKVGICTINDNGNYGNRLQNYAIQEVLKKRGINVETISNEINNYGLKYYINNFKTILVRILKLNKHRRLVRFLKFNKNIKFANFGIDKLHIPKNINKKYDYFITGSDQVWNPNFNRMSDIDFLTFTTQEKRIAFSASFGISELPENMKEYYKKRLLGIEYLSVREDRGKEIIEELTGRKDVQVLVDPTMLLTAEEWDKVAKKPKQLKTDKYILNYFLGELSERRKKEIERVAKENNCEVINILDKSSPFYETGPSEFLYLEKNAFLICTDSFHSSIFAILYDRPLIVFDREDTKAKMNSRLDTLLKKFKLENRWYKNKITKEQLKVDYEETYKILEEERKKAKNFIENAIK